MIKKKIDETSKKEEYCLKIKENKEQHRSKNPKQEYISELDKINKQIVIKNKNTGEVVGNRQIRVGSIDFYELKKKKDGVNKKKKCVAYGV